MPSSQAQEFLFQHIKELLPSHVSLVDAIAETLHISPDSAYRRIRGETPMVLDEVKELCQYYKISLDQLLDVKSGSTLFQNVRINTAGYNYETYLGDLLKQLQYVSGFIQKEIIYLTKDIPLFHNFYYKPFNAFRYFFWMKTIVQKPEFINRDFELNCVSPEIEALNLELVKAYNKIPSTEIWNTECINSAISQIEFYKDSGYFSTSADVKTVYESLEETILHLKNQAELGCKFLPDENPQTKKNNFKFFFNRVVLGDNTVMVITDHLKTAFLNYDVLNYMQTRDETFCSLRYDDLQNLIKKSTLISQTSEKQRNIFFGIMLSKIEDRKRNL
ncbi:MAG: helix-turn-helix domain-containing protein [Chitinophagales bacterium]